MPFFLPSFICVICCVVQCYRLLRRSVSERVSARNRRITVTVLQLTLLFFCCNTVHFTTVFMTDYFTNTAQLQHMYSIYITGNMLPFLNSFLNPVILITRGRSLTHFVQKMMEQHCNVRLGSTGSTEFGGTTINPNRESGKRSSRSVSNSNNTL